MAALVAPSWAIAVALSVPFAVQGIADSSHVLLLVSAGESGGQGSQLSCGLFNRTFAVYSSLVSFFLPLAVMLVADIRSIRILRNSMPRRRGCRLRGLTERRAVDETVTVEDNTQDATSIQSPAQAPMIAADENVHLTESSPKSRTPIAKRDSSSELNLLHPSSSSSHYLPRQRSELKAQRSSQERKDKLRSKSVVYINMFVSGGSSSVKINSRERRAEKTLIWVFVAFVVLWLPFFCTNLAYGLCDDTCRIPSELFGVFTWLGYLSSGVNPCIYTYLNRDFRNAFKTIITCKRIGRPRLARQYS